MGEIYSKRNKVQNTDIIPDNPNGRVNFGELDLVQRIILL